MEMEICWKYLQLLLNDLGFMKDCEVLTFKKKQPDV